MPFSPSKPIDASFRRFGVASTLDPDGEARFVRVVKRKGDADADFEGFSVRKQGTVYEIRAAEFAGFGKGAILTVGSDRLVVKSKPESLDSHGLVLLLDVQNA
ncbi:MAG: head-tail joining protein [Pelagimonas sp.]|uniref:head-tail joining protein n=1 Tax=Pelagimonas sp. TaxID=2073170 RepID=UPI003D6A2716